MPATHHTPLPLSALILAGGAGRRMQGQDKGWLLWQGAPLVEHALNRLRDQAREILISANRNQADYRALGCRVLEDDMPGYPGPLQGLRQGLLHAREDWLFTQPVDSPLLPDDIVERLWGARDSVPLVLARSPSGPHPLLCLCRRDLLPLLDAYLARGERRVQGWYADIPHNWVDFTETQMFNCNHPQDLTATLADDFS
ncbi:molybdenum cofactor guanylyltransferase MobA [Thermithiobacillus plumbiphilus]|uniref:Molybdenum cofactor guanylyltransferase n=1 Tax=Thermithiobacillus plumbiphilus TaxID=1729899 RepID=A0ABU9D4E4_9PROT